MSSKHQQTGVATDKKVVDTADPTVDDDNQSDSEYEYEYEEIEVEVDEDYEEEIVSKTGKVLISEVETIVPSDEKKVQETHVLKSDGTTEKLIHKAKTSRTTVHQEKHARQEKQGKQGKQEKSERLEIHETHEKQTVTQNTQDVDGKPEASEVNDIPKLGRALTSQEESILLPLLQGLLAANGSDISKCKQEIAPAKETEQSNGNKNCQSKSLADENDANDSAQGSNILDELSTALNRLQSTLLEEKEVVTDTRKRNTILTLVAWLKRVLQASTNDNAEAQLFSLTELLPTELLLTKLMPQLGNSNENDEAIQDDRSPASSKRFSRQRNNRFNTVGVSKEELADARLYLQKKLLSENLATTAASTQQSVVEAKQTNLLGEHDDNRRKSLNLQISNDLDKDIRTIFRESKASFSKSVDASSPEDANTKNVFPATHIDSRAKFPTSTVRVEQTDNQIKSVLRRKITPSNNQYASKDAPSDSDDEDSQFTQPRSSHNPMNASNKSKNKFALRKMQMKRANTIDVPKDQMDDTNSDQGFSDGYKNSFKHETINNIHQTNSDNDVDRNHVQQFQVKSTGDKKFIAFLNKNAEENHTPWVNPLKTILPVENKQQVKANNWSSKFGNIKNSFEHHDEMIQPVSPRLNKKNNFIHAPTSPFKPVQSNKPPQIPNGVHHYQYNNNQSVQHKVAAIQSQDKLIPIQNPVPKPQLRTHQSVPSFPDDQTHLYPNAHIKANDWQQNKYASVDSYMQNSVSPKLNATSYNPLYVPLSKQVSPSNAPYTSPLLNQMGPKPYAPFGSPQASQASQTPLSPQEFPTYTYTSTDYTQPTSVSTFGFEQPTSPIVKNTSPIIKNTILPDTSYLKSQTPTKTMPSPLLGSAKLNKQMKTIDVYSSNEYLSEPNYRSPNPFSPTYDNYATSHDSRRSSQEFVATSQIMKYPQCQTATVVNKSQRCDDEQQAQNLRSFLTSNVGREKRHSDYSEKSVSPFSESNFSHVNRTYVPPPEPPVRNKPNNSFVSMENISTTKLGGLEQGAPLRLRNNTAYYGSHNALVSNPSQNHQEINNKSPNQSKFLQKSTDKSKISAPVKLNRCGGQYIQPKVETDLDFSKPTFGKKPVPVNGTQNTNIIKNNITNINRSNTITHQRVSNFEVKRKQSLPAQNSEYFDSDIDNHNDAPAFSHNYLPFGALKKSKSTHTLALLQQFEAKAKSPEEPAPLPSYVKRPTFSSPEAEIKPKPIIKKTPQIESYRTIAPVPKQQAPEPETMPAKKNVPNRTKTPPQTKPVLPISPPMNVPIRSRTPPERLEPPMITETPSSPLVEDGHIIYPGQTVETKRRVQHYAKTLNAMLNRKSVVVDDEDDDDSGVKIDSGKVGLQRSKSGTLLSVPKQYESAIRKSEVLEKERTVAAYFSGSKSPQGLTRSSSQHSVLSSTSIKTVEEQKSSTVSPMQSNEIKESSETHESNSRTTTTKSAHHLKILRRQQKSTSPNPLAKSQTLPSINLLDESNVDDAFDDLFASFVGNK